MHNHNREYLIELGQLTITGKDSKGQEITIEAPVAELEIEVNDDYEPTTGLFTSSIFRTKHDVTFHTKLADGGKYTIRTKPAPKGVECTARVEVLRQSEGTVVRDLTIKEIRDAATKAGVSEDTEFSVIYDTDRERSQNVTVVEFKWTE